MGMERITRRIGLFGSIKIGGGTTCKKVVRGTVVVDPASIGAVTTGETNVTIPGAAVGDMVIFDPPATLDAGIVAQSSARVSATDTAVLRLLNTTAGAINVASATWRYTLIKF